MKISQWVRENFCSYRKNHYFSPVAVKLVINSRFIFQYNIRSYPTTILYNNSIPHQFTGHHNAADLVEFIEVSKLWVTRGKNPENCGKSQQYITYQKIRTFCFGRLIFGPFGHFRTLSGNFGHFRSISDTFWHFRTLSGIFGQRVRTNISDTLLKHS